jgi:hypothetical protein
MRFRHQDVHFLKVETWWTDGLHADFVDEEMKLNVHNTDSLIQLLL